jgi:hypothetical protein
VHDFLNIALREALPHHGPPHLSGCAAAPLAQEL